MIVTMGGMTIGQFLLDVADPDGVKLFFLRRFSSRPH